MLSIIPCVALSMPLSEVVFVSSHPTVNGSVLGMRDFLEQQGVSTECWSSESDVRGGDQLLVFYRDSLEFNPSASPDQILQMDQLAGKVIAAGWKLFNQSMPWVQDKAEEYELYEALEIGHFLPWQPAGAGPDVPQSFDSDMYVVKPRVGECGNGVERFANWSDASQYACSLGPSVIQAYQPGKVVRVIATADRVLTSYEKLPQDEGEWVAAIAKGARRVPFTLPPGAGEVATRFTKLVDADLIGFDLIVEDDDFWLLEANAAPGMSRPVIDLIDPAPLMAVFQGALRS